MRWTRLLTRNYFKKQKHCFVSRMVRAGERIKYCRVGHLDCHIYLASSIETLENKDINVNVNSLNAARSLSSNTILIIKEKNRYLFMCTMHRIITSTNTYFTFKYLTLHYISDSVFRKSTITCVTCEPWQYDEMWMTSVHFLPNMSQQVSSFFCFYKIDISACSL